MLALVLLTSFFQQATAQPLCTFAYSPCDPQDPVTGVCLDAPGQQCYIDIDNIVYCCVPPPVGPATTTTTIAPCTTKAAPAAPAPSPPQAPPPSSGICADVMPCCNPNYCAAYRTEMATICPRTCGYCVGPVGSSNSLSLMGCSDSITTCKQQSSLCTIATHRDLMRWQCTYTCGYCTSCVDHGTKCDVWARNGFCNNNIYPLDQIRAFCARTCGYCGTTTVVAPAAAANCFDANASCPTWIKNGFCTNTYYTPAQKKSYCARSCNLC